MSEFESRPSIPNPLGKCDRPLDLTVSEALEERLITMAALAGKPKATYAREILERAMFGDFTMMQMIANSRSGVNAENSR